MRAGRAFTQLVDLGTGFPDANITWTLSSPDGTVLDTGVVTPTTSAVSAVILISSNLNDLPTGDFVAARDLSWYYTVDGVGYGGDIRYTLEGVVPFSCTPQGVRDKLGVEQHELPDVAIPLMDAYLQLRNELDIDSLQAGDSREQRLVANALEAKAALAVLPTLQVRVAQSEDSGTNAFARFSKVDWFKLEEHLGSFIWDLSQELGATPGAGTGLFTAAGPATDPFTGA